MNIILLSGGSGKRLWPLSNDVRSKQFLRLFKNEDGVYESMIQRVYRQIMSVDKDAKITIATSRSQVSAVKNQLHDKLSICVEPCRKDTFPAIALAASYLKDNLNALEDECIIVCPVDPYVEDNYYEAIGQLESLVAQKTANLTLMGIEPTYPNEKYGYILPEDLGHVSRVKIFKEKPSSQLAESYIRQGALWNSGIFAFRLGYLLEKAHNMIEFTDYWDLYKRYETLESISFDYAVVENEKSIQVMRYAGAWKDVGNWSMVAQTMKEMTKGKVILNEECINTQVINELNLPILCMGCKDMFIAASSDGILISDKTSSDNVKPFVEKMDSDISFAEKSWGTYSVLDMRPGSMTVKIEMQKGKRMKYHSHQCRNEIWTILSGKGRVIVDDAEQTVHPGDVVTILSGCRHAIIADEELSLIEIQVGSDIRKSDKKIYGQKEMGHGLSERIPALV